MRGRWSEERACRGRHEHLRPTSGVAADMSGEVGDVCGSYGMRVGRSGSLSIMCSSSCS